MKSRIDARLHSMTQNGTHIGQVATIVVPVTDQDAALAFYTATLGMQRVNDFTYPTGERWLEVSPAKGSSNLCLVVSRPERPAGIETGVVLFSADVLADLASFRAQGLDVDEHPLAEGEGCGGAARRSPAYQRNFACSIPMGTRSSSSPSLDTQRGSRPRNPGRSGGRRAEAWIRLVSRTPAGRLSTPERLSTATGPRCPVRPAR